MKMDGRLANTRQTGGTSILGDQPISKKFIDTKIYSDKEDIYAYEVEREKKETYGQRVADIATVKIGEEMGVKTYIILPPTICAPSQLHLRSFSDLKF
jgi:hypothetical protein